MPLSHLARAGRQIGFVIMVAGALAGCATVSYNEESWQLAPEDPGPKPTAEDLESYIRALAKAGPIRAYRRDASAPEYDFTTGQVFPSVSTIHEDRVLAIDDSSVLAFEEPRLAKFKRGLLKKGDYTASWWICMDVTHAGVVHFRWANFDYREGRIEGSINGNPLIRSGCGKQNILR